ncbi:MAG: hypothetical protein R3C18_00110 [Planctomycetaceae bacterium]
MNSSGGSVLPHLAVQVALTFIRWLIWIPRRFAILFLADPTRVGAGYHIGTSLVAIGVMLFFLYPWFALGQGTNDTVWYGLLSSGLYAAWQQHQRRDLRRPATECGVLRQEIRAVLECLPIPNQCLTPNWQWRLWCPLMLVLASWPVNWWVCPALSNLLAFTGLFCFAIPGIMQAFSENSLRNRMDALVHQGEAVTGGSTMYQPATAERGAWLEQTWQASQSWLTSSQDSPEVVACPGCHTDLDSTGLTDGALAECPCGQQFQISRST